MCGRVFDTAYITLEVTNVCRREIIITSLIGASCIQIPLRIINFQDSLFSLLEYIIVLLSIGLGYVAVNSKKNINPNSIPISK